MIPASAHEASGASARAVSTRPRDFEMRGGRPHEHSSGRAEGSASASVAPAARQLPELDGARQPGAAAVAAKHARASTPFWCVGARCRAFIITCALWCASECGLCLQQDGTPLGTGPLLRCSSVTRSVSRRYLFLTCLLRRHVRLRSGTFSVLSLRRDHKGRRARTMRLQQCRTLPKPTVACLRQHGLQRRHRVPRCSPGVRPGSLAVP